MHHKNIVSCFLFGLAEILAILNDTVFYKLMLQEAAWYRVEYVFAYRLISIFFIGILLAFGMNWDKTSSRFGVFIVLIVLNFSLSIINHYVFFLRDFLGLTLMNGFSIGVIFSKVLMRKRVSSSI